jgi:hypothetical protein
MPCCENQYQSLDIDDDYKRTIFQSNVNIDFIASFIVSFFQVSLFSENKENQYANYLPPLLECDVTVLHQVFLI